jgi:hypothetical protein
LKAGNQIFAKTKQLVSEDIKTLKANDGQITHNAKKSYGICPGELKTILASHLYILYMIKS